MLVIYLFYQIPLMQHRQVCKFHLVMLRHALLLYREETNTEPLSFDALIEHGCFTVEYARCPFEQRLDETAKSYAWVAGITQDCKQDWPVAFDLEGVHSDGTRYVITVSGKISLLDKHTFPIIYKRFRDEYYEIYGTEPIIYTAE